MTNSTPSPPAGSLEHFAALTPDASAIVEGGESLNYREWNDRANRLANALAAAGIKAGDAVGVRSQIRAEWFVLNQALAKLGASQVAVNWRLTPPEARYIMEDSRACAIVYDDEDPSALANGWTSLELKLVMTMQSARADGVVRYGDFLAAGSPEPRIAAGPAPIVIYTSGTTGKPKGVVPDPKKLVERAREVAEYLYDVATSVPMERGARVLLTMPLHHGAGPAIARGCHSTGGSLYLLRKFDAEEALRIIAEHRITNWTGVPTMILRIAALSEQVRRRYDVSSLEALQVGAAPVSYALKEWIISNFGEGRLYEGYGATETGMVSVMPPGMQRAKPGSCGRLYRHVQVKIVDEHNHELPPGATGEILVRTPVTIDRYLNRDPLGPDTYDREGFFRVGDMGRLDADGYLYITDRKKDMIIAGGVNIYPAEIEAVLVKHPAIRDAAVIGVPHPELGEQVKAICEPVPGARVSAQEVIDFSAAELAPYKRPRSVDFVDELPRNPTGKVLKNELRARYWEGAGRRI
jgi:long-chain acyl-CoA synthetase